MPQFSTIAALQTQLDEGKTTTLEVVQYYLDQIEQSEQLNIYIEVFKTEALAQAKAQDEARAQGQTLGKLAGVVVSIKDVICYKDHQVTAASKMLEGFESQFSATAVERLLAADAIIIGRTNCDEFAMGSSNETSFYGPTRNAADPTRIPGGSSGASAVSVQTHTCMLALGSDTGGSVRQPAAFCGVVGFKPSYGRISRHGLLAYASSFDQIGLLAHHTEDIALALEVIAGPDQYDASASTKAVPAYSQFPNTSPKARIAYLAEAIEHPRLDAEVRSNCENFLKTLKKQGHSVEAVNFSLLDYLIPAYYVLTTAEASSNLARYDGIRYGYRSTDTDSLETCYRQSRSEGFGTEVKRRIMLGTFVLSAGYYDAYYTQAQKLRRKVREELDQIFSQYDYILLPSSPGPAWKLGQEQEDPVAVYLSDIYTVMANMAGLPAISIPSGIHAATGMPLGIQLMGAAFSEADLLHFATQVQNLK